MYNVDLLFIYFSMLEFTFKTLIILVDEEEKPKTFARFYFVCFVAVDLFLLLGTGQKLRLFWLCCFNLVPCVGEGGGGGH